MAIYNQAPSSVTDTFGYGAAISVAIFLIISLFVVIYVDLHAGDRGMSTAAEAARVRARPASRGVWLRRSPVGRFVKKVPFWLLIAVIFVYALFPFYWAVRSAFTPASELFNTPIQYFPAPDTAISGTR